MSWFESIAGCMLAVSLALRMLPDKKYEQYVRLFTGFLLLLLFLQPLLRLGSADVLIEQTLAQFMEEQEAVEQKIFKEGAELLSLSGEEDPEKESVREIIIEPVEVEVSGND